MGKYVIHCFLAGNCEEYQNFQLSRVGMVPPSAMASVMLASLFAGVNDTSNKEVFELVYY